MSEQEPDIAQPGAVITADCRAEGKAAVITFHVSLTSFTVEMRADNVVSASEEEWRAFLEERNPKLHFRDGNKKSLTIVRAQSPLEGDDDYIIFLDAAGVVKIDCPARRAAGIIRTLHEASVALREGARGV